MHFLVESAASEWHFRWLQGLSCGLNCFSWLLRWGRPERTSCSNTLVLGIIDQLDGKPAYVDWETFVRFNVAFLNGAFTLNQDSH